MKNTEVNAILKGLHLTNKDAVTDFATQHGIYSEFSGKLAEIVGRREGVSGYGWNPRSTWLIEYREALAMVIKAKRFK
jgi:hypothetical protein